MGLANYFNQENIIHSQWVDSIYVAELGMCTTYIL